MTLSGMYGTRLTRDFGESVPDPWASAIRTLNDHEIQRGLRRLANGGSGSTPTLPQFVKACRQIGEDHGPTTPRGAPALPTVRYDDLHTFGQKCLMKFLTDNGSATQQALDRMIEEKNRIVGNFRLIQSEEVLEAAEVRERLFTAFREAWKPITENEIEIARNKLSRTGRL